MGAWPHLCMYFNRLVGTDVRLEVIARPPSAAPATGSAQRSAMQQQHIIEKTFIRAGNSPKAKAGRTKARA